MTAVKAVGCRPVAPTRLSARRLTAGHAPQLEQCSQLAMATKQNVLCVGDSLTEGYISSRWSRLQSYPRQLQAMLGKSFNVEASPMRLSSALTGGHAHCRSWARMMPVLRNKSWHVVIVMLGTNDALSRQCDSWTRPKIPSTCKLPDFSVALGVPCGPKQPNSSSPAAPYVRSLAMLIGQFRANNLRLQQPDPQIVLVVPPPLLPNIAGGGQCTIRPHGLNVTAATRYLPALIRDVAATAGNVTVVNPFGVTACGTQRPSPVQSVRTFCQYFLHQIDSSRRPDPTREHNVVAFGDVVWSGDESFLRGDAFDMDGIHLNARGYSTIACAVRSALLLPGTSSLLEPVECGSAGFTHGPEAQRQAAIDPSRWSSTHSVCTAFLRNVSGYRR